MRFFRQLFESDALRPSMDLLADTHETFEKHGFERVAGQGGHTYHAWSAPEDWGAGGEFSDLHRDLEHHGWKHDGEKNWVDDASDEEHVSEHPNGARLAFDGYSGGAHDAKFYPGHR